ADQLPPARAAPAVASARLRAARDPERRRHAGSRRAARAVGGRPHLVRVAADGSPANFGHAGARAVLPRRPRRPARRGYRPERSFREARTSSPTLRDEAAIGRNRRLADDLWPVVVEEDPRDELLPRGDACLLEEALHVILDGVEREDELRGDLGVGEAPREQDGDLSLARRH